MKTKEPKLEYRIWGAIREVFNFNVSHDYMEKETESILAIFNLECKLPTYENVFRYIVRYYIDREHPFYNLRYYKKTHVKALILGLIEQVEDLKENKGDEILMMQKLWEVKVFCLAFDIERPRGVLRLQHNLDDSLMPEGNLGAFNTGVYNINSF